MVILPLDGAPKPIYLRPANGVLRPALGLKGRSNADGTLAKVAVAIDAPILTSPRDLNITIAKVYKQFLAEVLEGSWGQFTQFGNQARFDLFQVRVNEIP